LTAGISTSMRRLKSGICTHAGEKERQFAGQAAAWRRTKCGSADDASTLVAVNGRREPEVQSPPITHGRQLERRIGLL
jgi:hypothetical protein